MSPSDQKRGHRLANKLVYLFSITEENNRYKLTPELIFLWKL